MIVLGTGRFSCVSRFKFRVSLKVEGLGSQSHLASLAIRIWVLTSRYPKRGALNYPLKAGTWDLKQQAKAQSSAEGS